MSATEKSSNSAKRQRRSTSSQLLSLGGVTATDSIASNEKSEGWLSSCVQNFEPLQPFDNLQFEIRQEQDAENGEESHSRPESVQQSDALRQSGRARKSETRIQNSVVKCELTPPTGVQQSQALDKIEPCIVRR
jgi:hypothetical protein